jgi:hypothetical protein
MVVTASIEQAAIKSERSFNDLLSKCRAHRQHVLKAVNAANPNL